MKFAPIVSAAVLTLAAVAAQAQQPTSSPQPASAASAANVADCPTTKRARHDHALEKGTGPTAVKPCKAASGAKIGAKKIKGHDHSKFHKNQ